MLVNNMLPQVEQSKTNCLGIAQDQFTVGVDSTAVATPAVVHVERSRSNRKHVIIGLTCAVLVTLLTVGVLVAIKLITDSNIQSLKIDRQFELAGDTHVEETYYKDGDSSSWLLTYHLQTANGVQTWVIDDVVQGTRILKLKSLDRQGADSYSYQCYVMQYKPTVDSNFQPDQQQPSTTPRPSAASNSDHPQTVNQSQAVFRVSRQPINGVLSLVSSTARQFCDSLPVYMIYQADNNVDTLLTARKRRYLDCFWEFTTLKCRMMTFPDHPEKTYYGCEIVCS